MRWKNIQYFEDISSSLGKLNENPNIFKTKLNKLITNFNLRKKNAGAEPKNF